MYLFGFETWACPTTMSEVRLRGRWPPTPSLVELEVPVSLKGSFSYHCCQVFTHGENCWVPLINVIKSGVQSALRQRML